MNLKERIYDSLVEEAERGKGFEKFSIMKLNEYHSALGPDYDEKLLNLYEELIWKMSEFAGGRGYYQEIVEFIRKMFAYTGGKERARKLLESWRFCYDNRPAMQEELHVLYADIW